MLDILEKAFTFALYVTIAVVAAMFLFQSADGVLLVITLVASFALYGLGYVIKKSAALIMQIGGAVWQLIMKMNMTNTRAPSKEEVGAWVKSDYRENQSMIDQMPLSDREGAHERNQEMLDSRNDRNMGM